MPAPRSGGPAPVLELGAETVQILTLRRGAGALESEETLSGYTAPLSGYAAPRRMRPGRGGGGA